MRRKECWRLTWQGYVAILAALISVGTTVFFSLFPFLAVHEPVRGEILLVEGWVPDYSLSEVKSIFESGGYKLLVITGNPLTKGALLADYQTYPELTKAMLLKLGWPPEKLVAISSGEALRDRTYSAALAFKAWNSSSGRGYKSLDIYTHGAHCRRTRLLYQKALADQIHVGIIAGKEKRFDGRRWWKTSEGVRTVLDEAIAYVYARFIFSAPETAQ